MTTRCPKLSRTRLLTALCALVLVFGAIGLAGCGSSDDQGASPAETTTTTDKQKTDGRHTDRNDTDGKDTDRKDTDDEETNGQDGSDNSEPSVSNQVELSVPFQGGALSFSPQAVGTTSARRAVVSVRNKSDETTSISEVKFTGEASNDFLLADGTSCVPPLELEPGQRCSIRLSFAPTRPGERRARLTVTAADGIATAEVSGIGKRSGLSPAPPAPTTEPKKTTDTTKTQTTETSPPSASDDD
jgi:hypothetical protein